MKNLVKIVAVLTVFSSLGLIGMGAASTATSTAASSIRSAGSGVGAHARDLQHSHREYNALYRNRNRTPAEQARFEEMSTRRQELRDAIREGGVRNLNRAL